MRISLFFVLFGMSLAGQVPPVAVAGYGYRNTLPVIEAAPGQVLIVSVSGAQVLIPDPVSGIPTPPTWLATTVAGFSAQLLQRGARTPAGIYGVSQSGCAGVDVSCAPVTNLTLQIPFQLIQTQEINGYASLEISQNNRVIASVPVRAVSDKVHIIRSCDDSVVYYSIFSGVDRTACTAAVVRPRGGGVITPANPVRPGEQLVAFGYGFGDADPSPIAGPFRPGLTRQPFVMRYAVAGGPVYWAQAPDGIALTTLLGNYQVHFTMPPLPGDRPLPACGSGGLYGNVTVSIAGALLIGIIRSVRGSVTSACPF